MPRMTSTTIYLDIDQHDALKSAARRHMVPMSAIIRRGVDLVLLEIQEWDNNKSSVENELERRSRISKHLQIRREKDEQE